MHRRRQAHNNLTDADREEMELFLEDTGGKVPLTLAVKPEPFGIVQYAVVGLTLLLILIVGGLYIRGRVDDPLRGLKIVQHGNQLRCVHLPSNNNEPRQQEIQRGFTIVVLGHSGTLSHELESMFTGIANTRDMQYVEQIVIGLVRSTLRFSSYVKLAQRILPSHIPIMVCDSYDLNTAWKGLWDEHLILDPFVIFDHAVYIDAGWMTWLQSIWVAKHPAGADLHMSQVAGFSLERSPVELAGEGGFRHPRMEVHIIPGIAAFAPMSLVWSQFLVWFDAIHPTFKDWRVDDSKDKLPHEVKLLAHNRHHATWAKWFLRFVEEQGLFTIHATPPLAAVHVRKPGQDDYLQNLGETKTTSQLMQEVEDKEREEWERIMGITDDDGVQ